MDEIDAVGATAGRGSARPREREQTLNQLLVEMDGFETNEGVILIAATIAPTFSIRRCCAGTVRSAGGRAQARREGSEEILRVHSRRIRGAQRRAEGARAGTRASPAPIGDLVNEAALLAARQTRARRDVRLRERQGQGPDGVERRSMITATREADDRLPRGGHTLVADVLPGTDPVHKVTIIRAAVPSA